jgi:hypothetical protein
LAVSALAVSALPLVFTRHNPSGLACQFCESG